MNSTRNLLQDHITIRRVRNLELKCSKNLYFNKNVPIEHIEIISVIIEEFVDNFHHGKEEKYYFPETKEKDGFTDNIHKFLIEHELGRRTAKMLKRETNVLKENRNKDYNKGLLNNYGNKLNESVARFLKSYVVFKYDHIWKEEKFFELIVSGKSLSINEDKRILGHYELCKNQAGGDARIQEMLRLIGYLEVQEWMK